ncbi:hypothetical protein ACHAXN_001722 [Cyclotella atomus]
MSALPLPLLLLFHLAIQTSAWLLHQASSASTQVEHRLSYIRHHDDKSLIRSAATTSIHEQDITSLASGDVDPVHQILRGRHKWLGGAYHSDDGCVYGIPSHSGHVICLSPENGPGSSNDDYTINFLPLPSAIATPKKDKSHQFKWLRGIIANDTLFGIPAWFDGVLAVDLAAWRRWREENSECTIVTDESSSKEIIRILPLPTIHGAEVGNDAVQSNRWKWHGAALNSNKTAIYCIPSNADRILKVDLISMSTSYLSIPSLTTTAPLSLSNKWYGGILGDDNAIYGVPYAAGSVLRIDANFDTISLLGEYGTNQYNWHGGILANGSLYAFPAHAEAVLKIDTAVGLNDGERLSTLPIQRAHYDLDGVARYKWLGGSMGADGNVYGMPSDASSILRIDTTTNEVTTFGCVEATINDYSSNDSVPEKNKWQGGVLAKDGYIYAVPSNARGILRIDSRPELVTSIAAHDPARVSVIGNLPDTKDKWQGGFLVGNGSIYGIPENCDKVLEVKPTGSDGNNAAVVRLM